MRRELAMEILRWIGIALVHIGEGCRWVGSRWAGDDRKAAGKKDTR